MARWQLAALGAFAFASACTLVAGLDDLDFGGPATTTSSSSSSSSAGGVPTGSLVFTDDELEGEFGEGSFEGSAWSGERVELASGEPQGTFTSRVFDAVDAVKWLSLEWAPDAPYDKALPDGGASESGYLSDGVDMSANALLVHFDGRGSAAHGDLLAESSGHGLNPRVWHDAQASLAFVPGMFDSAIASTLDDHLYVDLFPGSPFDFGTGDFTWALWVRSSFVCDTVRTWIGIENAADVHLWLGCKQAPDSSCCSAPSGTQSGGTFATSSADSVCYCGDRIIDDGAWHHVALVKKSTELRLFVDGTLDTTTPIAFDNPIVFPEATRFTIGAFDFYPPDAVAAHQTEAHFDDVAVWSRGLDDAEIGALARRGQLSLRFQVRACSQPACADEPPFVGPDESADNFQRDQGLDAPPLHALALEGRYFQYRAYLETRVPASTPAFRRVTITADPL